MENFNNKEEILELNSDLLNKILTVTKNEYEYKEKLTFERRKSRIYKKANINVPQEYLDKYLSLLTKYCKGHKKLEFSLLKMKFEVIKNVQEKEIIILIF